MGVKCILLYKLPKGQLPVKEDAERLVNALTQQLYCVPEGPARSIRDTGAAGEKFIEAAITIYKQQQASDPSLIKEPKSLQDVWLFKLPREAPAKAYMLIKNADSTHPYRVTEAEPSIKTFLEKRLDYKARSVIYVQSQSWHMGDKGSDVTVKLLSVVNHGNQAIKVLALEVTYHPACLLESAMPVLQEIADKIAEVVGPATAGIAGQQGSLVLLQPRFYRPKPNDPNEPSGLFGPMHAVELYTELIQRA